MTTGAYVTKWGLSLYDEVMIWVPIEFISSGAEVGIRAVYSETIEDIASGALLAGPITVSEPGFYRTDWAAIPEAASLGEVYVGFVLEAASDVDVLSIGAAEVQVRNA